MMQNLGRGICNVFEASSTREWLVTNGIGGFAAGTVAGNLARHYHGLLIAALNPPLGRTLMLSRLDETAIYDDRIYRLSTNRWEDGAIEPRGFELIDNFRLDGTTPIWIFAAADALIEKRIWMEYGANTTYIQYTLRRSHRPLALNLKAIINYRDYHENSRAADWRTLVTPVPNGVQITAQQNAQSLYLLAHRAKFMLRNQWILGYYKDIEAERGLTTTEDHLYAADMEITLLPGQSVTVIATTNPNTDLDVQAAYARRMDYEQKLLKTAKAVKASPIMQRLVWASDQFIVQRGEGHTIIAGYPWFSDWGRDTMIALPGLTLTTGRGDIAASILRTFAQYVDQGMLPNRFPDMGEKPEYNTVDATLWYFEALRAYFAVTGDLGLVRELYPVLHDIIQWHQKGTRYRIHTDVNDGLLYAGEPDVQLTWMDVKIGDWVVTPRTGKPVEINALWYNALQTMADFAWRLGEETAEYAASAERVKTSFQRFWNGAYLYDVLDGEGGHDATIRPNQLFAVSLLHSPLAPSQQKAVVDVCSRYLLTPHGLRSLVQDDEAYIGVFTGDMVQRDSAYHQGTVWGWLIGAFVEAHLRVYNDRVAAKSYLEPLIRQLDDACVGSISEIFDGDAPHRPKGCFAQAWSVAEVLRLWQMVHKQI